MDGATTAYLSPPIFRRGDIGHKKATALAVNGIGEGAPEPACSRATAVYTQIGSLFDIFCSRHTQLDEDRSGGREVHPILLLATYCEKMGQQSTNLLTG